MAASRITYPASPPNRNLMAFGEVLGFASAMFPPIGQWPQSLRSDFCRPPACLCAFGPSFPPAFSPSQRRQQEQQGDSIKRTRPETRRATDQSGGEERSTCYVHGLLLNSSIRTLSTNTAKLMTYSVYPIFRRL